MKYMNLFYLDCKFNIEILTKNILPIVKWKKCLTFLLSEKTEKCLSTCKVKDRIKWMIQTRKKMFNQKNNTVYYKKNSKHYWLSWLKFQLTKDVNHFSFKGRKSDNLIPTIKWANKSFSSFPKWSVINVTSSVEIYFFFPILLQINKYWQNRLEIFFQIQNSKKETKKTLLFLITIWWWIIIIISSIFLIY